MSFLKFFDETIFFKVFEAKSVELPAPILNEFLHLWWTSIEY